MRNKKQLQFGLCLAAAMFTFYACGDDTSSTHQGEVKCSISEPCPSKTQECVDGYCVDNNNGNGENGGNGGNGNGGNECTGDNCGGNGNGGNECTGDNCGGNGNGGNECTGDNCGGNGNGGNECTGDNCGGNGNGGNECTGDNCGGNGNGGNNNHSQYDMTDTDGDTIPDTYDRCDEDTDEDGIPNCRDLDSDGDGIPDSLEAGELAKDGEPVDSDFDGDYDFIDMDSDNNGIPDNLECRWGSDTYDLGEGQLVESCLDTDGDGEPDYIDKDNDGDNIYDAAEIYGLVGKVPGSCSHPDGCASADCDNDGHLDPIGTLVAPFKCVGDVPGFMNVDSDGDGIPDVIEGLDDSDKDSILDIYSLDSDGDGIPDSVERCGQLDSCDADVFAKTNGKTYDFKNPDIDADGLRDGDEIYCENISKHSRYSADVDGDNYSDAAEQAVALYAIRNNISVKGKRITSVSDLLCDPNIHVKDVFEFYFELPYQGPEDDDTLYFSPAVSKLDLVFNVDTTGSMSGTINSVKTNISSIITKVRGMVSDSGFALTSFDDFPGVKAHDASSYLSNAGGGSDMPFTLMGKISTNKSTVEGYMSHGHFTASGGADGAESGTESLYHIATGKGVRWLNDSTANQLADRVNEGNTWGGVDFRQNTLPVVVHATDVYSHEANTSSYLSLTSTSAKNLYYQECSSSITSNCVYSPHYTDHLVPALKRTGVRVISLDVGYGNYFGQMTTWSRESNAIVPACAFKKSATEWTCGENKCCLGSTKDAETVNGVPNQCILVYTGQQSSVADYISQGVDALVKYGTYEVSTTVIGDAIPGKSYGTECFIKRVEALQYFPPEQEPEKSCNPTAVPYQVSSNTYNDGFRNFATGTSTVGKPGARLTFKVVAENDHCVEPTKEAQVFEATIRVINPTTGLKFDDQKVSIIVPAETATVIY